MRKMGSMEERRCWDCGKFFMGKGVVFGDKNSDVRERMICNDCLIKAYNEFIKI